jgi:hypothetical protein
MMTDSMAILPREPLTIRNKIREAGNCTSRPLHPLLLCTGSRANHSAHSYQLYQQSAPLHFSEDNFTVFCYSVNDIARPGVNRKNQIGIMKCIDRTRQSALYCETELISHCAN